MPCGGLVSPDAFWATVVVSGVLRGVWSVARKGVSGDRAAEVQRSEMRESGAAALASAVSVTLDRFVCAQHEILR